MKHRHTSTTIMSPLWQSTSPKRNKNHDEKHTSEIQRFVESQRLPSRDFTVPRHIHTRTQYSQIRTAPLMYVIHHAYTSFIISPAQTSSPSSPGRTTPSVRRNTVVHDTQRSVVTNRVSRGVARRKVSRAVRLGFSRDRVRPSTEGRVPSRRLH